MTKFKKAYITAFVLTEAVLCVLVQCTSGVACKIISFSAVLLACLFSMAFRCAKGKYLFTQLALLATVAADVQLVLLDGRHKLFAMVIFSAAQLLYAARTHSLAPTRKALFVGASVRLIISAVAIAVTLVILGNSADALSLVSMFYYANLLLNILFAFLPGERSALFATGLVLFALCDATIGFAFLGDYLAVAPGSFVDKLANPGFNLAWLFYVPSQTLISLSLAKQHC